MGTDIAQRWENYRRANSLLPSARENELLKAFELADPAPGERILEVGTGNGYLTFPLAEGVAPGGEIVTADVTQDNLTDVERRNRTRGLKIQLLHFNEADFTPFSKSFAESFDAIASIATLHHFDDRKKNTGESGRRRVIGEFFNVLKKGGRMVLADPAYGTITQRYFDRIDNPMYCHPNGHPHNFFTLERLTEIVTQAGFQKVDSEILYVPWKFSSPAAAKEFVHTIHNARCSADESFAVAADTLGFKNVDDHFELGWELFFLTATK